VVNVLRNREAAGATAEAVRKHGVQARTMRANVSEPAAIDRMCEEIVAAASSVDIMVRVRHRKVPAG
jgi:NAD(P)-dependent dehydrogenase (short-subunit alcohol dehydrogenase family)